MYETHDKHNNKMRQNKNKQKNLVHTSNAYLDGDRTKHTNQEAFNTTTKQQQS